MASVNPLDAARLAATLPDRDARPTHPLRAWRESQRLWDHGKRGYRAMTIADAARRYGAHIGREVAYQVWRGWELYRDEEGSRIPNYDDVRGLFLFTRGQVRPDHYYELPPLRAELSAGANDAGEGAEPGTVLA